MTVTAIRDGRLRRVKRRPGLPDAEWERPSLRWAPGARVADSGDGVPVLAR